MKPGAERESKQFEPIGPIFRSKDFVAETLEIPDEMLARWKTTANLMAEIAGVPTGVITRVHATQLEVLVACDREDNPYTQGLRADLNTGMCCETVMQERAQLLVPNALKDPEWANNPNVSLGLISYLGLPLQWDSGEIFGTICVLDKKENTFGDTYQKLLETFKHAIESDLKLVTQMAESRRGDTEVEQMLSERRYLLALIESTSDFVGMANMDGEVMYINPAGMAMLGRTGEDYRSLRVADTHPDEDTQRLFEEGQPILKDRGIWHTELSMVHRNGSLIPTSMVLVLLRSSAGEPVGMATIVRDISGRIEAENELREARDAAEVANRDRQHLLALIESTTDFVGVCDMEGKVIYINPAGMEMIGRTGEEYCNLTLADCCSPEDQRRIFEVMLPHVMEHGIWTGEIMMKHGDGKLIHCSQVVVMMLDNKGEPVGMSTIVRDISKRLETEQELQQAREAADMANRAKSQFLSSMSHELRTPLNGVLGYVQILQRDPALSRQHRECLDAIESCGQQLLILINDVLDLSKIESGKMELDPKPCDLPRLLNDVHKIVSPQAVSKGLQLALDVAPDVPRAIVTDAMKLRQVLVNLLGNSVKFTETGSIELCVVESSPKWLCLAVKDTGVGISQEKIDEIFDPFKQVEAGVESGGTGLGLAISRRLIEALGGRIEVESTPGEGSCFTIFLPLVEADDAEKANASEPVLTDQRDFLLADEEEVTVLIADDRDSNRDILVRLLQAAGFHTVEAVNGKDALSKLREHSMPLVLMDVRMPEMNGLEATREIRNDPALAKTVIIAVSASVFPDSRSRIVEAGCDDFIAKPIHATEVFSKIERHLKVSFAKTGCNDLPDTVQDEPARLSPELACDIARQIRAAVEIGDITELSDVASKLAERQDGAAGHGETINRLVKAFDFDGLMQLAHDLDASSQSTAE